MNYEFEYKNLNIKLDKKDQSYIFRFFLSNDVDIVDYYHDLSGDCDLQYQLSWSHDQVLWSPYIPLNNNNLRLIPKNHYFKIKYTLLSDSSSITIHELIINVDRAKHTDLPTNETSIVIGNMEVSLNMCISNINDLFNNYSVERQMSYLINKSSVIDCHYFRTEPDMDTVDVFLSEYSLYNTVDNKCIRIIRENNDFPDERPIYSEWGYEWEETEIFIDMVYFMEIFGGNYEPRNKDYIYIKKFRRMYSVKSHYIKNGINGLPLYHVLNLVKYDDEVAIDKSDDIINSIGEISNSRHDLFNDLLLSEMEDISNPIQNTPISSDKDHIRNYINQEINIELCEVTNNSNIIMNSYYDMTKLGKDDIAIRFNKSVKPYDITLSMWFHPIKDVSYANAVSDYSFIVAGSERISPNKVKVTMNSEFNHCHLLILEYVTICDQLYKIVEIVDNISFVIISNSDVDVDCNINFNDKSYPIIKIYQDNGIFVDYSNNHLVINLNGDYLLFEVGDIFNKWNGIVLSISKEYSKIFLDIYNLYDGEEKYINKLNRIYTDNKNIEPDCLKFDELPIEYISTSSYIGYMRMWKNYVNEDYHNTILTSIHVTNSSKTHIIDNCSPNYDLGDIGKDSLKYNKPSKFQ